jgi:hypothetical protein
MRIADDTEAIGRRYRELFRPGSEQPSPPKPEPETKSAAETTCRCGRPVGDCFFCVGSVITGCQLGETSSETPIAKFNYLGSQIFL